MTVKILGIFRSPFVMSAALAAAEKEVDFEVVPVALKSDDYLNNYNPFGQIPSFQDEVLTLYESRAIIRYIATKYEGQGTPLLGSSPVERALCDQWLEVNGHHFTPAFMALGRTLLSDPGNAEAVKEGLEKLGSVLDKYEARLTKAKFLAGDSYTMADLAHGGALYILGAIQNEHISQVVRSRPRFSAWVEDITSRPAFAKVMSMPENTYYGAPWPGHKPQAIVG